MTALKENDLLPIEMEEDENIGDLKNKIYGLTGENGSLELFCCMVFLDDDATTLRQLVESTKVIFLSNVFYTLV